MSLSYHSSTRMTFGCQQNLLSSNPEEQAVLEYLCQESNKVYNCALYFARQIFFKAKRFVNRAELCSEMAKSKNIHFGAMYVSSAQQTCNAVAEAFKSFTPSVPLNASNALGIDHGINNWLTCVSNVGTSFIIDGRHLKSKNQWYNKRVAALKEGQAQGFWSQQLATITEKRNRQMRDAINKAARLIINHCLEHQIGTVVFGWNQGQKDHAKMGRKINQQFVQIPTARLKQRLSQLCEQYGIRFVETEEAHTSAASFLDNDSLPKYGEKPEGWKASGRRVKRGLYRTAANWYVNADANGAANILRKVAATLGLDLSGTSRGDLTTPLKVRFWAV